MKNLTKGLKTWEIIAWIIIIIVIIWAFVKERDYNLCYDFPDQCGEEWQWTPKEEDGVVELLQRLDNGNQRFRKISTRRVAMIVGFVGAFAATWILKKKPVPKLLTFLILFFVITGISWFSIIYYESHRSYMISDDLHLTIDELRYELGLSEKPQL